MPHRPVLVVEDDEELCYAFVTGLQLAGFEALGVANGQEALDLLQRGLRPCLILLDVLMPEMNGIEFRTKQLASPELASIPVAICTALPDIAPESILEGIVALLQKPVEY